MPVTTIVGGGGSIQLADVIGAIKGNIISGRYGAGAVVASVYESELTTTSATVVLTHTPKSNGLYLVQGVIRVAVAATTMTITVTYYDASGSQQTQTLINAVSEPVGDTPFSVVIPATTTGAINVNATAGTANQAYVSAVIMAF